ncbi:hypothetical protein [Deinococcus arenicola]|uniref:DUF11 domain-containing protein n=1 Tax=Deinococcus arenicola TaxID=2994950 RepID=A0ABU4DTP3_9DEIO|nr:hypothetical protein [Deinococcus sp. ZS9-10]MDV6375748.1 hypothetical protein [Deinococcus sp. ZS9-10]
MMTQFLNCKAAALTLALVLVPALAQTAAAQNSPLRITGSTLLVTEVQEDGKTVEKLTDTANRGVSPGNLLQLQQRVENVSRMPVKQLKLDMAVPAATTFTGQQCDVPDVKALFSIDGKAFAAEPLKKFVTITENGQDIKKEVTVSPSEYTNVRWQMPDLKGGATATCSLRATVK